MRLTRREFAALAAAGKLVFANPSPPISVKRGPRVKMTIRVSEDDGLTWPTSRVVHLGPSAYSSLARIPGGQVGLLYEAGRFGAYETIRFALVSMPWLEQGREA